LLEKQTWYLIKQHYLILYISDQLKNYLKWI
jgi:hypothetical protein